VRQSQNRKVLTTSQTPNCCVQDNSLIEANYWSQFGFLAVGRLHGNNPHERDVGIPYKLSPNGVW
jgi:hypothetical protein